VEASSPQNFVGTHGTPSATHDDDSGVLVSEETYEQHYGVRENDVGCVPTNLFAWLDIERWT
jgi:hypothetical protein